MGWMSFLSANHQCQSTEGNTKYSSQPVVSFHATEPRVGWQEGCSAHTKPVTLILKGFVLKYMEEETDEPADPGHLKNGH